MGQNRRNKRKPIRSDRAMAWALMTMCRQNFFRRCQICLAITFKTWKNGNPRKKK